MKKSLPPDPENMNETPARWAENVLHTFHSETGIDDEDAVTDLLCALMHLTDRKGWDFGLALKRAQSAYAAETKSDTTHLVAAARTVIECWSSGDLAEAVRHLDAAVKFATGEVV